MLCPVIKLTLFLLPSSACILRRISAGCHALRKTISVGFLLLFFSDGRTVIFVSMCSAAAGAAGRQEQLSCVKSVLLCAGFGLDQFM